MLRATIAVTMLLALSIPATAEVIGGRPRGCPHAFCGCGASLHLFGRIIPALNRAAEWFRFPRAPPALPLAYTNFRDCRVTRSFKFLAIKPW